MKILVKYSLNFILAFVVLLSSCTQGKTEQADSVYVNGKIYTVNKSQPWAEAIAIKDGKILKVGSDKEALTYSGSNTEVVDLEGKLVIPGLIDSHSHPGVAAYDLFNKWALPSTFDKPTWEQLLAKLKEGQKAMADDPWFLGHSYTRTVWPEEKYNRWFLDEIFGDQPVFIYMEGQHESIANSKALEIAGVDKNTPDPAGSVLGKDPKTGELNGVLYEDGAARLIEDHIPALSLEKKSEGLVRAMAMMHGYGYTGAFDAQYGNESTVAAYGKLLSSGSLPMHIKMVIDAAGYGGPDKAPSGKQIHELFDKYNIPKTMRSVKIQMDGSIEGYTSPMLEGFLDKPGFNPPFMAPEEMLRNLMKDYDKSGLQILTHSIGDSTVRLNLDLFEEIIVASSGNPLRHKIDHAVVVSEEDIPRFAKLGIPICPLVVVNQDMPYTQQLMEIIGPKAKNTILPSGRLMNSGAILCATSDWPGSPEINPYNLMEVMVTRRGLRGTGERIGPEEDCVTLEQAIKSFTINGAWVMGLEKETGSIEEGKWADFVVLDKNMFELPVEEIGLTDAEKTIFKGLVVYDAEIHTDLVEDISPDEIWSLLEAYQCPCDAGEHHAFN